MADEQVDVAVIGAGLSGLTAAFHLRQAGLRVQVWDSAAQPGGALASLRRDGCVVERGASSALDHTPLIGTLLDALGLGTERIDASATAARRYLIRGGRVLAVPAGPGAFIRTPLLSWRAKLALLGEPLQPRAADATADTVAAFVTRRLGREVLDHLVEPIVGGIYGGDPAQLSMAAAFPKLAAWEHTHGSLLRGAWAAARARRAERRAGAVDAAPVMRPRGVSFSFRHGMQALTDALAQRVGTVSCGVTATAVAPQADGGFLLHAIDSTAGARELRARAVVLALPAPAAASLLDAWAGEHRAVAQAAAALRAIRYAPMATVGSLFRRRDVRHALDGFGCLAPAVEQAPFLGTLFASTMFADRAPAGHVLLTSFVGGMRQRELAAREPTAIAAAAQTGLTRYFGAEEPLWHEVTRWPQALPQYEPGHLARMAALDATEQAIPRLAFCASYRGGVSIGDCIVSGTRTAERLAAQWHSVPARADA
jgi:oxygen-dependent protoporphyrinogen oxidase